MCICATVTAKGSWFGAKGNMTSRKKPGVAFWATVVLVVALVNRDG
jgi:hypothetical protein